MMLKDVPCYIRFASEGGGRPIGFCNYTDADYVATVLSGTVSCAVDDAMVEWQIEYEPEAGCAGIVFIIQDE
jgi:hypothetical protein